MTQRIRITVGSVVASAEFNDSPTAQALAAALPITARAKRWGEKIYLSTPLCQQTASDARTEMAVGKLASWPPGQVFCIFFGPTPASSDDIPCAASPANPLGRILGDPLIFRSVTVGTTVVLEKE